MYGLASLWSVCWIYTDSNITAMIHSRFSWDFLPQVAQAKTRRRRTKGVCFDSAGGMRSFYDSFLYHMGRGYAGLYMFSHEYSIIARVQYSVHTLFSYYSLNMEYKVNAKLAIGQLQFVTPPPIGGRYLISDVTNVVRLRI